MTRPRSYTDEELAEAVSVSSSFKEAVHALGLSGSGESAVKRIRSLDLDTSHFTGRVNPKDGITRSKLSELIRNGFDYESISVKLGISRATISYHVKSSGLSKSRSKKFPWDKIAEAYQSGSTAGECREMFGMAKRTWDKRVSDGTIKIEKRQPPSFEVHLKENSNVSRAFLKRKMVSSGIKKNECEICAIGPEWNGKKLVLQLDHINGINNDNRLANIRLLCPNCHSQTENFCGKNIGKSTNRKVN